MGKLYTWGWADSGRLGNNTTTPSVLAPAEVNSDTDWDAISLGFSHALAIKGGQLYAWGDNGVNELGDGTTTDSLVPLLIDSDTDWEMVSAGASFSLAIKAGKLYSWGSNGSGRTAQNTLSGNTATPTQVGVATDWEFISGSKSQPFAVAIKGGQLYAWGLASYGALGNGVTVGSFSTPQLIDSDTDWSSLSAGARHVLAIKAGKLYSWGAAANGRLGNGTTSPDVSTPTQVGSDTTWEKVAAGNTGSQEASLAIKEGTLYSCGYGSAKGLGVANNFTDTTTFTQVGSDTDWSDVSAGSDHAHGLRAGSLFGWGTNSYAQVGDGTGSTKNDPVQIGSATTWAIIAGGRRFSAAIENANVAPANTVAPAVSGTATVGETLTTTDGTWDGTPAPTFTYKWQVSDDGSTGWTDISGATSSSFTITSSEAGKYIRSEVTATNSEGSASEPSAATSQVLENPVISTPTISGTAKVGETLTASASATAGFPSPSLSYEWQSSPDGSSWTAISGETSSTLLLDSSLAGAYARVQVTATNSEGTDSEVSTATSQITQDPIIDTPFVSGETKVGQTLTATANATEGFPTPSISYQWLRADTSDGSYLSISGATSSTYVLQSADLGKFIKVEATATNSEGSNSQLSAALGAITEDTPPATENKGTAAIIGAIKAIRGF